MSEQPISTGVRFDHPAHGEIKIIDRDAGLVEEYTPSGYRRRKVAIVGFSEATRNLAPFDDPEWSIWGVNQLYRHIPRASRWFEIHKRWNEHVVEGTDHAGWLAKAPIPTYMVDRVLPGDADYAPGIPNSVKYPLERILAGPAGHPDYFTSTIAYMIALAIEEGYETIGLYGIDLIVGTEWFYQKACAEFWLGVCHGRNLAIDIPSQSALLKASWRYGYEAEPPMWPISMSKIESRLAFLKNERHKLMMQLSNIDGALQEVEFWHQVADIEVKRGARQTA